MYDLLLINNSNYDPILHRLGDTATYRSNIADLRKWLDLTAPLGAANTMQ